MAKTPEEIKGHSQDYKNGSWEDYSYEELGQWINLLTKRAAHRSNMIKADKDLHDAYNYFKMLESKLISETNKILKTFEKQE